jgi:hypothetical protein
MESVLAPLAPALQNPPPWLAPYLPVAQRIAQAADGRPIADALNAVRDERSECPRFIEHLGFVKHSALPPDEPYESFIARTRCVPTRDNLHDLFNGLMWLCYPQAKRRLNELQAEYIAIHGRSGPRGALRDALTVFDENAAVLQAPAELLDALRRRDWRTLFITQRSDWQSARLVVFGHALLEKLLQPRKAITAHVWAIEELTDAALASSLTPERLTSKPFLPLPILGVPGWWSANEDPRFYDEPDVFRPLR